MLKRNASILVLLCLWVIGIYFLIVLILGYYEIILRVQNKFSTFLANYQVLVASVLALLITAFGLYKHWSNKTQFFAVEALFRYFLGFSLLIYGLTKILQTQFVTPTFVFQEPLEKLSGINLTWAFLGRSSWFQVLLGFLEFVPAILLLFRRTAVLGAILMLPMTINVCVINYALNLWSGTKLLSLQFLAANVIILLLEWRKIRDIFSIVINKNVTFRYFRWEAVILVAAVIAYLYPVNRMLMDYRDQKNELTGDWFNRHPFEWELQEEKINDSILSPRILKSYFGVYGAYSEMKDKDFVYMNYTVDEKQKTLSFHHNNGTTVNFSYRLINDIFLETQRMIDSSKNIKLTQLFRRRIISEKN